jgi:hypothetical protein
MLKAGLKALISSAIVGIAAVAAAPAATLADPESLEGTWSGGGSVNFASGSTERAKCRASFSRSSATSYRVSGTCATQSGKVTQNSEVFKTTANRYRGNFHNPEFDISGTIAIVVNGRSMTATLTTSSGTGVINLRH